MEYQAAPGKKRSGAFKKFFTVFLCVDLAAILLGLGFVWMQLSSYENSMPMHTAQAAADLFRRRDYEALRTAAGWTPSEFESEEDFAHYIDWKLGDAQEIEVKKQHTGTEEVCYELLAGETPLAQAVLEQDPQPDRFGRQGWQLAGLRDITGEGEPLVILAPETAQVRVNGQLLDDSYSAGEAEPVDGYTGLPEGYARPQQKRYELPGLLTVPEVTAEAAGTVTVEPDPASPGQIRVSAAPEQAVQEEVGAAALAAAQKYAQFITADASFGELSGWMIPGSECYQKTSTFYSGWYLDHESIAFEDVNVGSFVQYSPDHVSCELSFVYVVQRQGTRHEFPSAYQAYMIRTDAGWKAADLRVM